MNKRGDEDLLWVVGYVVIILLVYGSLSYWVNNAATGNAIKDQAVTKQVALLVDSAGPGAEFNIYREISIEGRKIKSGLAEYEFFTSRKVSTSPIEGGVKVKVE